MKIKKKKKETVADGNVKQAREIFEAFPLLLDDQADLQPDELLRYKELIQSQGRRIAEILADF